MFESIYSVADTKGVCVHNILQSPKRYVIVDNNLSSYAVSWCKQSPL